MSVSDWDNWRLMINSSVDDVFKKFDRDYISTLLGKILGNSGNRYRHMEKKRIYSKLVSVSLVNLKDKDSLTIYNKEVLLRIAKELHLKEVNSLPKDDLIQLLNDYSNGRIDPSWVEDAHLK